MGTGVRAFWEGRAIRLMPQADTLKNRTIEPYNPKGRHTGPELEHIVSTIKRLKPAKVLDVGSGYGMMWLWLTQKGILPSLDYTCCDFADNFIALHEEVTGLRPTKWDGAILPFGNDSFDFVVSYAILLHVPPEDIGGHLSELVRVSRRWLYVHTALKMEKWGVRDFKHDYCALFANASVRVADEFISTDGNRVNWLLEIA